MEWEEELFAGLCAESNGDGVGVGEYAIEVCISTFEGWAKGARWQGGGGAGQGEDMVL